MTETIKFFKLKVETSNKYNMPTTKTLQKKFKSREQAIDFGYANGYHLNGVRAFWTVPYYK